MTPPTAPPAPGLIRLATASPPSLPTTAANLAQARAIARRCPAATDILLLPEAYLGGYPRGSTFGSTVGARSAAGRDEFRRYFARAVDLEDGDGDGTRAELEAIAAETGVFLVVGCVERAGGSLYCAVVFVCPRLGVVGKRRKVMPTGTERLIWAQGSPATLRAVTTVIRGVRVNMAAAICWESYMPLLRQALYAQNVNLYLAPTADGRDAWLALMRTVGVEGRCFVVSSNLCYRDGGAADEHDDDDDDALVVRSGGDAQREGEVVLSRRSGATGTTIEVNNVPGASTTAAAATSGGGEGGGEWVSRGGSSIVDPYGDVLAGPQWEDSEGIIYADVDFGECIRGRLDLDVAGSYSRNDSFKFSVEGLDLSPLPY